MIDDYLKFSPEEIKLLKQILSVGASRVDRQGTVWKLYDIISRSGVLLYNNHWGAKDLIQAVQRGLPNVSEVVFDDACRLLKKIELLVTGGAETSFKKYKYGNTIIIDSEPKAKDLKLLKWQEEALTEWENNNCKGIIHAVTGSGKSYVGIGAIERFATNNRDYRIIILVPTIHLLKQWLDLIIKYFPSLESLIGARGGYYKKGFSINDAKILVLTYQSAVRNLNYEINIIKENPLLFIIDECHRYGSDSFGKLLNISKPYSALGLSAYPFRLNDDGFESFIEPRIGKIIYSYDYKKALQEKVICNLEIVFIDIPMNPSEEEQYNYLTDKIVDLKEQIYDYYPQLQYTDNIIKSLNAIIKNNLLRISSYNFIKQEYIRRNKNAISSNLGTVVRDESFEEEMSSKYNSDPPEKLIIYLFSLWAKRQMLIHRLSSRFECTLSLAKNIPMDNKIFLFHQYIEEIEALDAAIKADTGHNTVIIHSGRRGDTRAWALEEFKSGKKNMLISCRVLDEGVDVPDANVAIFSAISKSPTQMIQRTGRVLRPQKEKAKIYILYASATVEDWLYGNALSLFEKVFPCKTIRWPEMIESSVDSIKKEEEMPENDNKAQKKKINKTAVSEIVLTAWRWYRIDRGIYLDGEVENNSNKVLKSVRIIISLRDNKGEYLGAGSTYLEPSTLSPGGFSVFGTSIYEILDEVEEITIKYNFEYNEE